MTTKVEGNAGTFNVEVVSLTGDNEPFSLSDALSEVEWIGLLERFAARKQHFQIVIGFKGRKRVATMVIPPAFKDKGGLHLKLDIQQRFALLGCDKYLKIM